MKLKLLLFGVSHEWCRDLVEPETTIETKGFGEELPYLEGDFFGHIAAHNLIYYTVEAEKNGCDAAVIGCFLDPGLKEIRELVRIPVIGAGEATLHLASMLVAGKFSVVVGTRKAVATVANNARNYGVDSRIASWRLLGLTVPEMLHQRERTEEALRREVKAAVEQDGAEAVCLGCTAMVGQARKLQDELGIPILDPITVGVKMAEMQALLWKRFGVSHSKAGGYEPPPEAHLAGAYNASYGALKKILYTVKNRL